jgi:hypothetical protein
MAVFVFLQTKDLEYEENHRGVYSGAVYYDELDGRQQRVQRAEHKRLL